MIKAKGKEIKIMGDEFEIVSELGLILEGIKESVGLYKLEMMIEACINVIHRNEGIQDKEKKKIKKLIVKNLDKEIANILCELI